MKAGAEKSNQGSKSAADHIFQKRSRKTDTLQLESPGMEEDRPGIERVIQRAGLEPGSLTPQEVLQLHHTVGNQAVGRILAGTLQKKEKENQNKTGMPDHLKSGIEQLSGLDMSDVQVHYRSSKPAQLNALAYTQGTNIHVAPGQEKHLPHESWHMVQQKQNRVKPTMQMKDTAINDDPVLEKEADMMGTRAVREGKGKGDRLEKSNKYQRMGTPVIQGNFEDYLKSVGVSLLAIPHGWIVSNFKRIPDFFRHLAQIYKIIPWLWEGLKILVKQGNRSFIEWLSDAITKGLPWVLKLFLKLFDIVGGAEIIGFVMQIFNFNTRLLTQAEKAAATVVYGNTLPYWKVRVNASIHQPITALYNGIIRLVGGQPGMIAITAFHYIEIGPGHAGNLNNVVHELGHVKQQESVGMQYMSEAIHAALWGGGYGYNPQDMVANNLRFFNREQQCRIAEHYWALQTTGSIAGAHAAVQTSPTYGALMPAITAERGAHGGLPGLNNYQVVLHMYQRHIDQFKAGRI